MNARTLLATNTAIRTVYGVGAMFAPNGLARAAGFLARTGRPLPEHAVRRHDLTVAARTGGPATVRNAGPWR